MRTSHRWRHLVVAGLVACLSLAAQAAAPLARVRVEAKQPVLVGQQIPIEVEILAPNYFTSAPPFPMMEIPGAIVTMPDETGHNFVDVIDGQTFAGIRKTYIFSAQQAGDFVLPPLRSAFTYGGDDGKPVQGEAALPQTRIAAVLPQGAAQPAGAPQQPVARITLAQRFDRPLEGGKEHLQAGDALVRTLDAFAEMTQAMMIPPPRIDAPDGVRVFRADPRLSDTSGGRQDFQGGHRIDEVTYVFEKPGTYTLPAVDIAWFDAATGTSRQAQAPAVTVVVDPSARSEAITPSSAPALGADESGPPGFWQRVAWKRWLGGLGAVLLVGGVALRAAMRRWPAWKAARAARQARRRVGEPALFEAVAQGCAANDPARSYAALLRWAQAHLGCSTASWSASLRDDELARRLRELEARLYAGEAPPPWNGDALLRALRPARARWLAARDARARGGGTLRPLNP